MSSTACRSLPPIPRASMQIETRKRSPGGGGAIPLSQRTLRAPRGGLIPKLGLESENNAQRFGGGWHVDEESVRHRLDR